MSSEVYSVKLPVNALVASTTCQKYSPDTAPLIEVYNNSNRVYGQEVLLTNYCW